MDISGKDEEVVAHKKSTTELATSSEVEEIPKPPPGSLGVSAEFGGDDRKREEGRQEIRFSFVPYFH